MRCVVLSVFPLAWLHVSPSLLTDRIAIERSAERAFLNEAVLEAPRRPHRASLGAPMSTAGIEFPETALQPACKVGEDYRFDGEYLLPYDLKAPTRIFQEPQEERGTAVCCLSQSPWTSYFGLS